ncbi:MAG: 50S ribosomal protein L14e [Nanoarchaeota archaeon]
MMEVGRLCIKIAGRDAGQHCVILDMQENRALIDGQVRRRQCNVFHLEPLSQKVKIAKNASHEEVVAALKKIGIVIKEKKRKEQPAGKEVQTKKKEKESKAKVVKA